MNDSILLVEEILRHKTQTLSQAVFNGYARRLRPILLTSLTTAAGLMPIILESSYQAQFLIPIAITISAGILLSTFMTMIAAPAVAGLIAANTQKGPL